jgi:hypothetical protein
MPVNPPNNPPAGPQPPADQLQAQQQTGMSLQKLYGLADSRSYYSKTAAPEKIWAALTEAARRIYLWIAKENRGYFIKWDYTTINIVANQDEYACPPDLGQMLRFSERDSTSTLPQGTGYRTITPMRLTNSYFEEQQFEGILNAFNFNMGARSLYTYIGPYLLQAQAEQNAQNALGGNVEIYRVRIAPMPAIALSTEVIYVARFLELSKATDYNVIPPEGRGAMLDYAIAELVRDNNDDLAEKLEAQADKKREEFLTWIRERQYQQYDTQQPFLDDLD